MNARPATKSQRSTIVRHLRTAADRYESQLRDPFVMNSPEIHKHYKRQAEQAFELARAVANGTIRL